jgi:hypothetical protein
MGDYSNKQHTPLDIDSFYLAIKGLKYIQDYPVYPVICERCGNLLKWYPLSPGTSASYLSCPICMEWVGEVFDNDQNKKNNL